MSAADDPTTRPPHGDSLPESAVELFRKQSQLDFDLAFFDAILEREPDYIDVLRCQGELLSRRGFHERALVVDRRLAELKPRDAIVLYNLACSLVMNGLDAEALAGLREALDAGYDDFEHLAADKDLDGLRASPAFQALLRRYAADL